MSDSFEKIAKDALMDEYDYCEEFDLDYGDESCPAEYAMHSDLVRRMEEVAARGYRVSGEFNYCSKCGAKIETYNGIEDAVKTWNTRAIDRDELLKIADELENEFFVVYDSYEEIDDHADCFVERIRKAVGE